MRDRPRCGSCVYWQHGHGGASADDPEPIAWGHCHHGPPDRIGFPPVTELAWCGRHPDFADYLREQDLERLKQGG